MVPGTRRRTHPGATGAGRAPGLCPSAALGPASRVNEGGSAEWVSSPRAESRRKAGGGLRFERRAPRDLIQAAVLQGGPDTRPSSLTVSAFLWESSRLPELLTTAPPSITEVYLTNKMVRS